MPDKITPPDQNEPDYKESSIAGKKWRRSLHGEFGNNYGGPMWIRYDWEDRVLLDDGTTFANPAGSTTLYFNDPDAVIELSNPKTGQKTGTTITHGDLHAMLWSLAMESAKAREEEEAAAAEAEAERIAAENREDLIDPH